MAVHVQAEELSLGVSQWVAAAAAVLEGVACEVLYHLEASGALHLMLGVEVHHAWQLEEGENWAVASGEVVGHPDDWEPFLGEMEMAHA